MTQSSRDITLSEREEPRAPASPVATRLARTTLRWSGWPGRRLVGTFRRKASRARGGTRFEVRTSDGIRLDAWYSPAAEGTPDRLPVVLLHGWIETKEFHFRRAWKLNRRGHDVVLYDHRAHGCSDGRVATFGCREREDLAAVIAEARRRQFIRHEHLITMGYSMGAAVALQHAPSDPNVAGVVAMAPFVDFREAVRSFREKLAPWMDEAWLLRGFERAMDEAGFCFDDCSSLEAMKRIEVPVLLVEGMCDQNLPPAVHTKQLAAAKTRGPLQVVTIDEATHCGLTRQRWPELERAINAFCDGLT